MVPRLLATGAPFQVGAAPPSSLPTREFCRQSLTRPRDLRMRLAPLSTSPPPMQPTCVVSPGRACMRRSSPACVRDCAGKGATLDGPVVPLGRVLYSSSRSAAEGSEGSEGPGQMIDGASNIVQLTRLVQQLQQKQQEQEHKIVQLSLDVDHLQEETAQRLVLQFVSLVGSRLMAGAAISSVSQKAGMQLALENKRGLVRSAADVLIMLEPGLKLERQTFAAKMDRVYHLCNGETSHLSG